MDEKLYWIYGWALRGYSFTQSKKPKGFYCRLAEDIYISRAPGDINKLKDRRD